MGQSPGSLDLQPPARGWARSPGARRTMSHANLTDSIDQLAEELGAADGNVRARALGELVRRGPRSTPALVRALDSRDVDVRVRAAQGLGEIADPANADLFVAMLDDRDDRIRARGAQGLARIGDPRALEALVRTIDDFEDVLHVPGTLSSYALAGMGPAALVAVAPLLSAPGPMTRQRAFQVVQRIVSDLLGAGEFVARWREMGSYDPTSDGPQREAAAAQWRAWITRTFVR